MSHLEDDSRTQVENPTHWFYINTKLAGVQGSEVDEILPGDYVGGGRDDDGFIVFSVAREAYLRFMHQGVDYKDPNGIWTNCNIVRVSAYVLGGYTPGTGELTPLPGDNSFSDYAWPYDWST